MNDLTPEQNKAALRAEIAGFIAQDMAGRGVDAKQATAFYKRACNMIQKRSQVRAQLCETIVKTLPAAA